MRLKPLKDGGRQLVGDVPFGKFSFELDAAASGRKLRVVDEEGREVGRGMIEIRQVIVPPAVSREEVERRVRICGGCEFQMGIKGEMVKCDLCGCDKLSIAQGDCPRGWWEPMKDAEAQA